MGRSTGHSYSYLYPQKASSPSCMLGKVLTYNSVKVKRLLLFASGVSPSLRAFSCFQVFMCLPSCFSSYASSFQTFTLGQPFSFTCLLSRLRLVLVFTSLLPHFFFFLVSLIVFEKWCAYGVVKGIRTFPRLPIEFLILLIKSLIQFWHFLVSLGEK